MGNRQSIRSDIKHLVGTSASLRTSRYVTHCVATGFTGGDSRLRKVFKTLRNIIDFYIMQLDVLTCGDVQDSVRIFFGKIRYALQLVAGHSSCRQLGSHHLLAVLTLTINSLLQTKPFEVVVADFAPVETFYLCGEGLNFFPDLVRNIQCFCIH